MTFFKRSKGNLKVSDKAAIGIANTILKSQRWFGTSLHDLTKKWKQKQQWIFLYSVCLVFGGMSMIGILKTFKTPETSKIIIPKSISIPKNIYKEDKAFIITKKEFQQVQEYKNTHPNLLKERPGLFDSLSLIEQVYYSQQK